MFGKSLFWAVYKLVSYNCSLHIHHPLNFPIHHSTVSISFRIHPSPQRLPNPLLPTFIIHTSPTLNTSSTPSQNSNPIPPTHQTQQSIQDTSQYNTYTPPNPSARKYPKPLFPAAALPSVGSTTIFGKIAVLALWKRVSVL